MWSKSRHVQVGAKDFRTPGLALVWDVESDG